MIDKEDDLEFELEDEEQAEFGEEWDDLEDESLSEADLSEEDL